MSDHEDLPKLKKAKSFSDDANWHEKHVLLRSMLAEHPDRWEVDQDDGHQHAIGIRHESGFKFHLPREQVVGPVTAPAEKSAMSLMPSLSDMATSRLMKAISEDQVTLGPDGEIIVAPEEEAPLTPEEQAQDDMIAISEQVAAMQRQRKAARPAYYDPRDWTAQVASALELPEDGKYHPRTVKSAAIKCPNCQTTEGQMKLAGAAIICRECNRRSDITEWEEANPETSGSEKKAAGAGAATVKPVAPPTPVKPETMVVAPHTPAATVAKPNPGIYKAPPTPVQPVAPPTPVQPVAPPTPVQPVAPPTPVKPVKTPVPVFPRPIQKSDPKALIPRPRPAPRPSYTSLDAIISDPRLGYGDQAAAVMNSARAYRAANPNLHFINQIDPSTAARKIPVVGVPNEDPDGASADYSAYNDLIQTYPSRKQMNGEPDPEYDAKYGDTISHESLHGTQRAAIRANPTEARRSLAPRSEEDKLRKPEDFGDYLTKQTEVMARLPRLNRVWVRAGNPFPTTQEEAAKMYSSFGIHPPGQPAPSNPPANWRPKAEHSDIENLIDYYRNMPESRQREFYRQVLPLQPGLVMENEQPGQFEKAASVLDPKPASTTPTHELVFGPSGAGKTTKANQLAEETGLPIFRIDDEPEWKPFVAANDYNRDAEGRLIHAIEGTPANKEWKALMRKLAERALARKEPHIIEGTHLMTLTPDELRGHNLHLVNPPLETVKAQRIARSSARRKEKGRPNLTRAQIQIRERLAEDLYNSAQPAAKVWESIKSEQQASAGEKKASVLDPKPAPLTGPDGIKAKLASLDLEALAAEQHAYIKSGKVSKRDKAVKILNIIEGLKRNKVKPEELMIHAVPVIPAVYRPFAMAGGTFIPGDANELYKDLFTFQKLHRETHKELGPEAGNEAGLQVYNAVKALYGYGEPVNPKTASRGVTGFFKSLVGTSPKYSVWQRQLISKPMDNISRATVSVNPELGIDQVGIPRDHAWKSYAPYIQGRLVGLGYSPGDAVKAIRDRTPAALQALERELPLRPGIVSRAPAWHKFNALAQHARLVDGDSIQINPFITTSQNMDFDGDQVNFSVPASDAAVREAHEKLLPSKMVFGIRDPDVVINNLKHEQILGSYAASQRPSQKQWKFGSKDEAISALKNGTVPLHDDVTFPGSEKLGTPLHAEV